MEKARVLMDAAIKAARTDSEKQRIEMASQSLSLFDDFMKLREDLAAGRLAGLDQREKAYIDRLIGLGTKYEKQFAFGHGLNWANQRNVNCSYFNAFYKATYDDAARIAKGYTLLNPAVRQFRFSADEKKIGEKTNWQLVNFDDSKWRTTDVAVDTWSALGLHNYMGSAWYRTKFTLPEVPKGKKVWLWISATDGRVKVFANGKPISHVAQDGKKSESFSGHCQPVSFDVTESLAGGRELQLSLFCTREFLNELGTGGLLSPVAIYREK